MQQTNSNNWLEIKSGESGQLTILDHGRLEGLVAELVNSGDQCPSLCVFLGTKSKEACLRQLYPHNNINRRASNTSVRLRCDVATQRMPRPAFFADGDLTYKPSFSSLGKQTARPEQPITWQAHSFETVLQIIYARLLFLFTDVVCIFAADFASYSDVADFLISIHRARSASLLPASIRPRVVIVLATNLVDNKMEETEVERLQCRLNMCETGPMSASFSAIHMVRLGHHTLSDYSRYQPLRDLIKGQIHDMQSAREDTRTLLSANHLAALFSLALRHTAEDIRQPFDFVQASRAYHPVSLSLGPNIVHYQELGSQVGLCSEELAPSVASALLMDHYIDGMLD
ncbi:uncharacterized protein BO97DRAFT_380252 [Aspergillus homomorphus CBS 101889]|uniref:Uncharacterized protein n=1 Tax=Aspergillus homomorphus (strain CBS 101889) TaxID=1450537 RepID=A0A395HF37_ASPHC|nr:hypothetical protein BO97DRAFT_380252 [Aspergillus homomorphus CBS 101889]RAL06467.1 hypothetical protein BO97DRAFT_380252 [Aspergillus homomorphus CBS 101889]